MAKICFVSYEIHPVTPGGCGVLLYNSARVLLEQGHEIIFLFDMPSDDFANFEPQSYPNGHNCRAYLVEDLCADITRHVQDFSSEYSWRAYRFHWATQHVYDTERPDLIEFFDYNGVAHYALSAKITNSAYNQSCLVVRLHNPDQLINRYQPQTYLTHDEYTIYALEHSALRMAEVVLYPSLSYLDKAYRPHYEPWLGQTIHSKPALSNFPKLSESGQPKNRILFYGRLFGFKGVDLLVDAGVKFLSENGLEAPCFTFVGYDSSATPDGSQTYQEYLLKRIPEPYPAQFEFLGQLRWAQLEKLLPHVQYAVFPGYFESFCYAAHELYAAGLPIILNDIPAFQDYFKHGENALLFDGTVADLARQMKTLWQNPSLQQQLSHPFSVADNPLGNFYEEISSASWIRSNVSVSSPPTLLICILDEGQSAITSTLESIKQENIPNSHLVLFTEHSHPNETDGQALWFLGKLYSVTTPTGEPLPAVGLKTAETLLILRAGDVLHQDFLPTCLSVLARQPELTFVGAWKRIRRHGSARLSTFPLDAALELIPFEELPLLSRVLMRTAPGTLLIDLFDPRLMQLGEVGYLWDLETNRGPGVLIPDCLLDVNEEGAATSNATLLAYLVAKDVSARRKARLTNYLLTLKTNQDDSIAEPESRYSEEIAGIIQSLGRSKMGRLIGDNPFLVKWSKALLRRFKRGVTAG